MGELSFKFLFIPEYKDLNHSIRLYTMCQI